MVNCILGSAVASKNSTLGDQGEFLFTIWKQLQSGQIVKLPRCFANCQFGKRNKLTISQIYKFDEFEKLTVGQT